MADQETFESALDTVVAAGDLTRLAELRLVYADWLDEHGDPAAGVQRWMAREGKCPLFTGASWDWWRYGDRPDSKPEDLPRAIWQRLPGEPLREAPDCKEYSRRLAAERALYKALMLLDLLPS